MRKLAVKNTTECLIQERCRLCAYVNINYQRGLERKYFHHIELLKKECDLSQVKALTPNESPRTLGYRAVAKLAIRKAPFSRFNKSKNPLAIGLFKQGSHEIIDIHECQLHMPCIKKFVGALKYELEASTLTPWDERTLKGDLRYVVIRASHLTDELLVTFVVSHNNCKDHLLEIAKRLKKTRFSNLKSVYLNINESHHNEIFGPSSEKILGQNKIRESLCGLEMELSPTSFFQVNPWQAEQIYRRITSLSGETKHLVAWDLYSGTGIIALNLAKNGYHVLGIEENPASTADALENSKRNGLDDQTVFQTGCVENQLERIPEDFQKPHLIVANPSRRGLDIAVRQKILEVMKKSYDVTFIYMSCETKTLARDLHFFQEGGLKIRQLEAFDMFPQTEKLEWLVVLTC